MPDEELELKFDPPDPFRLEAVVEESEKCPRCGGGIRSVLDRFDKTSAQGADLDVLFVLYCRNAECGWMDSQWRPWSSKTPNVI